MFPAMMSAIGSTFGGASAAASFGNILGSIGGVASGVGKVLGGLGIGGGEKRPRYKDALNAQMWADRNAWDVKMQKAKEYGIHPLAALGVSPAASPAGYLPSPDRFDPSEIGQGIQRAANVGRDNIQRELDEAALEHAKLSNDFLKTQIAGSLQAISNSGSVPAVRSGFSREPTDRIATVGDKLKAWKSNQVGIDDGILPKHRLIVDQDGDTVRIINPEAVEDNEILMLLDAFTSTLPDQAKNTTKKYFNMLGTSAANRIYKGNPFDFYSRYKSKKKVPTTSK